MKKTVYLLIAALLFPLAACRSENATGKEQISENATEETMRNAPLTTAASENSANNGSADENAEPVWNTADTDVSHVDISRKLISFTFDDAPDSTMKGLLNAFTSFNESNADCPASATFFCNGIRVDASNLHMLEAAYHAGFELGNHTDSHKNLIVLSPEKIKTEIDAVDKILQKIDGKEKHLVRAPYGNVNDKVRAASEAPLIDWAIDTEDWKGIPAEKIYNVVYSERRPGAIVLMHDGYKNTVEAVKKLLPALKEDGYQVVNVSQLSKALDCPFFAGKVYTHVRQHFDEK